MYIILCIIYIYIYVYDLGLQMLELAKCLQKASFTCSLRHKSYGQIGYHQFRWITMIFPLQPGIPERKNMAKYLTELLPGFEVLTAEVRSSGLRRCPFWWRRWPGRPRRGLTCGMVAKRREPGSGGMGICGGVGRDWRDVELCWTMLNYVELCWTMLNYVELCWTMLNYVELS